MSHRDSESAPHHLASLAKRGRRMLLAGSILALAILGMVLPLSVCAQTPRVIDDGGFGNRNNNGIVYMEPHGNRLYAGTWNPVDGCFIYTSEDGRHWEAVVENGFGDTDNQSIVKLRSAGDYLYAGTWNRVTGGQLWRSDQPWKAETWEAVTADGFGDPENQAVGSICSFDEYVFVGMFNPTAGEQMWVSTDGSSGSFLRQFDQGLGIDGATDASYLYEWNGHLYLGTEAAQPPYPGCDVWRMSNAESVESMTWTQVSPSGFGGGSSFNAFRLIAFNDRLYVGTWEYGASSFTTALGAGGTQIWRTSGREGEKGIFDDWAQVNEDGFGFARYDATLAMAVWEDQLYVGGFGNRGFLFRSADGDNWHQVTAPGFLTTTEFGVHALAVFNDELFIGIQNWSQPSALWVLSTPEPDSPAN